MLEKIVFSTKAAVAKKTSRFRVGDVILIPSNLTDIRKAKKAQIIQITDNQRIVFKSTDDRCKNTDICEVTVIYTPRLHDRKDL